MLWLALLGVGLETLTGALGGHLAGAPSAASELARFMGWKIYTTFFFPD
jgi:hypothetical protein